MPKVAKGRRKRAYRPRSSTGCHTCKVRRVKCDETHPTCKRCISTGRVCDGYEHHLVSSPVALSTSHCAGVNPCVKSAGSFKFFVRYTCHQFAGFFASNFWERSIPQAAHREPAIWHALVAIGALHESLAVNSQDLHRFALEQYSYSIQNIMKVSNHEICLLISILFTSFEDMRGQNGAAKIHISSGVKLLKELFAAHAAMGPNDMFAYTEFQDCASFFSRLQDDVAKMANEFQPELTTHFFHDKSPTSHDPWGFESIEKAKLIFERGHNIFRSVLGSGHQKGSLDVEASIRSINSIPHITTLMKRYSSSLDNLVANKSRMLTELEKTSIAVLRLNVLYAHVKLSGIANNFSLISRMQEMVHLGRQIATFVASTPNPGHTSFCLDIGYIIPLHEVARKCADFTIRQEAIDVLRWTSRQEGLWNSILVAQAAECSMQIEQEELLQLENLGDKRGEPALDVL